MKVILAHDSFTQLGGAERVITAFHELFPDSPVYTLVFDKKFAPEFTGWDIRTSWLNYIYTVVARFKFLLPLLPSATKSLHLPPADIVLSSSSLFLKALKLSPGQIHISYCHTPVRFLWTDKNYVDQETPWLLRPLVRLIIAWLRRFDFQTAQKVTHFIANSREVQQRIKEFYARDSTVIEPFIDTHFWHPTRPKQDYFLIAGRLHAHKGNELIIELFNELGWPLHVVGTGRQESYLRSIAQPNITFLGRVSDEILRDEYSGAKGFIYPQLEDFGLMPLEAAGCGTASLGLAAGGSLETILPGRTGELFTKHNPAEIKEKLLAWDPNHYQVAILRAHAEKFSKEAFKEKIERFINQVTGQIPNT